MKSCLLADAALAFAAVAAEPPLPQVTAEPQGDGSVLRIRNVHSQPITAFIVEIVDYPGNQFAYWWDQLGRETIAPRAEKRIPIGSMMPGTVPEYLKASAVVYADGTSGGIADKVRQILDARRLKIETIRELIRRIELSPADPQSSLRAWSQSSSGAARVLVAEALERLKSKLPAEVVSELRALLPPSR